MNDEEKLKAAKELIEFLWKHATMSKVDWLQAGFYLELYHGEEPTDQYGEPIIPANCHVKLILADKPTSYLLGESGTVMKWDPVNQLYTVGFSSRTLLVPPEWLEQIGFTND